MSKYNLPPEALSKVDYTYTTGAGEYTQVHTQHGLTQQEWNDLPEYEQRQLYYQYGIPAKSPTDPSNSVPRKSQPDDGKWGIEADDGYEVDPTELRNLASKMHSEFTGWQQRLAKVQKIAITTGNLGSVPGSESFVDQVAEILAQTGMQPGNLELEITEGVLASDRYASRQTLAALRELGVRIAIDDFGTGYSSLAYLKRFPVDVLKIDQSFVRDMLQDRSDAAIIEAIIKLAQALGLELVAEGVECPNQERALAALGCPVMQGYLYCRPVPRDDMSRLLADGLQA